MEEPRNVENYGEIALKSRIQAYSAYLYGFIVLSLSVLYDSYWKFTVCGVCRCKVPGATKAHKNTRWRTYSKEALWKRKEERLKKNTA